MNAHSGYSTSLTKATGSFLRNKQLIWQMTKREVLSRYRGSVLGLAWAFFNPLLMLVVYTVVFSVVFKARWDVGSDSKVEFALVLFIGLIIHSVFAECLMRAPGLILSNVNYVKKVVFPLEILPWVIVGSAIFNAAISLIVWALFFIVVNHTLNWTVLFVPIIFLPLVLFSFGISWFLASLGVYLRDVGQITGVVTTFLLFMSPILYPISMLPEPYRIILYLNPLTFIIEQARDVLMWGKPPDYLIVSISLAISTLVAWLGYAWFQKTRNGFADVL